MRAATRKLLAAQALAKLDPRAVKTLVEAVVALRTGKQLDDAARLELATQLPSYTTPQLQQMKAALAEGATQVRSLVEKKGRRSPASWRRRKGTAQEG